VEAVVEAAMEEAATEVAARTAPSMGPRSMVLRTAPRMVLSTNMAHLLVVTPATRTMEVTLVEATARPIRLPSNPIMEDTPHHRLRAIAAMAATTHLLPPNKAATAMGDTLPLPSKATTAMALPRTPVHPTEMEDTSPPRVPALMLPVAPTVAEMGMAAQAVILPAAEVEAGTTVPTTVATREIVMVRGTAVPMVTTVRNPSTVGPRLDLAKPILATKVDTTRVS